MVLFSDLANEFTAFWATLLLFLPFFALRRYQRPKQQAVGGLEPFRGMATEGKAKQKKLPLSFWLYLLAYLLAACSLFEASKTTARRLHLVDQSPSALRAGIVPPEGHSTYRLIGSASESVLQLDLLQALYGVSEDQYVTIWTDLQRPRDLPNWVLWRSNSSQEPEEVLAVLLSAQPVTADAWRVHWSMQEYVVASVQCGSWDSGPLIGTEGSLVVPVPDLKQGISLAVDGERVPIDFAGGHLVLPEVKFQLPLQASPAWKDAALAAWPSAEVVSGDGWNLMLDAQQVELPAFELHLSWELEPQPEQLAFFSRTIRAAIQTQHAPRDAREYLPQDSFSAEAFAFPVMKNLSHQHLPAWVLIAGWLSFICAAFAWFLIPREDKSLYSEV